MKKILSKKILTLTLLVSLFLCFNVLMSFSAHAQDVELLPNASPRDAQVETAPYKGQEYEVQTAAADPFSWVVERTLGVLVRETFNLPGGENLDTWMGDTAQGGVMAAYTMVARTGGDACIADPETGAILEDNCPVGYTATVVGGGGSGIDYYCQCTKQTSNGPQPLPPSGIAGHVGSMSTGILAQSPPNLHTASFFKNTLANNVLSTPAYAATGQEMFKPVVKIWRLMRNIAYVLMVLILVGMGFMVMLRAKIDPRTTMTVTAALPKLAVALVLIAFSYPIAGIIVDLGRVLKGLIDAQFGPLLAPLHMAQVEPFAIIGALFDRFAGIKLWDPMGWGTGWGNIYLGGTGLSSYIIGLGMRIIVIVVAFMLFFTLVTRFAGLFMQVVFAPFVFAWGALPGQEDTTTRWFKSFAVNVLSFPVIYLLINFATYIADKSMSAPMPMPEDLGWGAAQLPFGLGPSTNVGGLVAFGLVMAATKVPALLEDAFDVAPSGAAARAGVDTGKILGKLPVVGKIIK